MTTSTIEFDLDKLLDAENINRETVSFIKTQVYSSKERMEEFEERIESLEDDIKKERDSAKSKDWMLLLGICEWIVGDTRTASRLLREVKSRKIGSYYLGKCYNELGDYNHALECFERAKKTDTEEFDISMDIAETKRMAGSADEALRIVKSFLHSHKESAELFYQWGHCLDDLGEYQEAFAKYEQALQIDPNHPKALFRVAFNCDMDGEDEKAIEYYERCANLSPTYKNAFINLGILYEDNGKYEEAMCCYGSVLDAEPNNGRALLFSKDVKASTIMYYDEEVSKKQGKEGELLNIPITDFELSVRSRNCLEKMNIRTLNDLTMITEADLLSFKNFGETSLNEIKSILAQKGLRLGQGLEKDSGVDLFGEKKGRRADLARTIYEIGLSVRCRNTLRKIGIETIEDLTDKSDIELDKEGIKKNYIDEIKETLLKYGLSLKTTIDCGTNSGLDFTT